MRKVIVLVCMIATMVLCICGAASADRIGNCIHDYGNYRSIEERTTDTYTYFSTDEHTHYSETFTMLVCSQCGDLEKEDVLETETRQEPHRFEEQDGERVCADCGYQCPHEEWENGACKSCGMSCPHNNTGWQESWSADTVFTSVDNSVHHVSGTWIENQVCLECGEIINTNNRDEDGFRPHSYNGTLIGETAAVCADCGHENSCEHTENHENFSWHEGTVFTPDPSDTTKHTAQGSATVYTVCDECGMYLSIREETDLTHAEEHSFTDGECVQCGYQCLHDGEHVFGLYDWDEAVYAEIEGDNVYHTVTGEGEETCRQCWITMNDSGNRIVSFAGYHHYNGNVCEDCGHICTHNYDENGYCEACGNYCPHTSYGEEHEREKTGTFYENRSEAQHAVYGRIKETYQVCEECGHEDITGTEYLELTGKEDHAYTNDGYCVCGAYCPHNGIESAETVTRVTEEAEWFPKDASHHVMATIRETRAICPVCQQDVLISREIAEETEGTEEACEYDENSWCSKCNRYCSHHWENGECTICHRICTHEARATSYRWAEGTTYTNESAWQHVISGTRISTDYCMTCGEAFGTTEEAYEDWSEVHSWNGQFTGDEPAICEVCGVTNDCGHEDISTHILWENVTYSDPKAESHHAEGSGTLRQACNECGMYLSDTYYAEYACEQNHQYDAGVCQQCGYVCPHEQLSHREEIDWEISWTYEENANDNREHTTVYTGAVYDVCEECGAGINRQENQQIRMTEGHSYSFHDTMGEYVCDRCGHICTHQYDENGWCSECGYQCDHANAVTIVDSEETEYEQQSAQEHLARTIRVSHISCERCNYTSESTSSIVSEIYEEHTDNDADGRCDGCGSSYTSGDEGEIDSEFTREDWDGSHGLLVISGSGEITESTSAQWAEYAEEIDQIIIGSQVTGIGANAFANLPNTVRVDFNERIAPTIDETAFSGTDAIFRHYTQNDSWPTGDNWIYLPIDNQDGTYQNINYSAEKGWSMTKENNGTYTEVYMSAKQAKEETYRLRGVTLYDLPTAAEFEDVCCEWDAVFSIAFYGNCSGDMTLNMPQNRYETSITCDAPGMNLTVTSESRMQILNVEAGTVTCTADMDYLMLRTRPEDQGATVTVTGDIETLSVESYEKWDAYKGSLTLNGSIKDGYVYSDYSFDIPNVPVAVPIGNIAIANLSIDTKGESKTIISNGQIMIEGAELNPEELYYLRYELNGNQWGVSVRAKDGLQLSGPAAVSLAPYKADFDESDIAYSERTDVYIFDADEPVELTGQIYELMVRNSTVTISGPVFSVNEFNAYHITINNHVDYCYVIDQSDSTISLTGNGYIGQGYWYRRLRGTAYFDTISGPRNLYSNGHLHVMSWKDGQQIAAVLPSDDEVTRAAGLVGNTYATADVSDSATAELSIDESAALNEFMTDHEGAVAAIFDATITSYTEDAEGNITPGAAITNLNEPVEFAVSNNTGDECYIVRLHDEGDGMTATQLTEPSSDTEIPFESDMFSKYAIIASNWTAVEDWSGWTFGEVGEGIDKEWVLHITGSGEIPDYSSPAQAPWYTEAAEHENIRIVIDEGVTKVGRNAFGGLKGTVRADFRGATMPTVSTTAFSGTTAKCRYYYENESWATGISGRADAQWIYLPVYEEDTPGRFPINYGYADESTTLCWYLQNSQGNIQLTMEQAEELSYKYRVLDFDKLPKMSDTALYDTGNVPWQAYFGPGCDGIYVLNEENGANTLDRLDINAPEMTLIINRVSAERPMEFAEIKGGTVTITGDVTTLSLRNSNGATPCSVTITGDVDEMDFYNVSTGGNAYSGDAEIIGTIWRGYEYGSGTMDIPGIGDSVPLGSFITKSFSDLTRTEENGLLIDNGVLTLGGGEYVAGGSTDIEDYRLEYSFIDDTMDEYDRTVLTLTPKSGGQGIDIDILEQKPTFSPADIIRGSDTDIHIGGWDPRTPKSITLGSEGEGQGFNCLFINSTCGTINLNCPVNQLEVYQNINSTNTLELNINNKVENTATLSLRGNGNTVRMGENGWLAGGVEYEKPLTSTRVIPAIQGKREPLIADGRLTVMSSKAGESLESILPGDSALAMAAGMTAVMDIGESTEPLNEGELEILEESLQIGADEVAEVFNVTVTGYDAGENPTQLDKLNGGAVQMAIKNTTGEEVYVARLHEENGQMRATAVSEPTAGEEVWFASDLFSKYVLVKPDNSIDPSTLLTLKLPDSLTRIEDYAFAGGAFQAVIIPDGCTYIGEHAFDGCGELIYISYPASYESGGIEIKESAFDGCGEITHEIRQGSAGR